MLELKPFHHTALDRMGAFQPIQAAQMAQHTAWRALTVEGAENGPAWAVWDGPHVLATGGLRIVWQGRALAWALVADEVPKRAWPPMVLHARRMLRQSRWMGIKRIEAIVPAFWEPGERLVAMLGFRCEAVMPQYGPDGSDYGLWSRIEE